MASVNAADKKKASQFSKGLEVMRCVYDSAVDSKVQNDKVALMEANADCVIMGFYCKGLTSFAGVGASIDVGVEGGDEDILLDGTAVAALTANALVMPTIVEGAPNVMPMPLKLASGSKVSMTILGAALTAGKAEFVFLIAKF